MKKKFLGFALATFFFTLSLGATSVSASEVADPVIDSETSVTLEESPLADGTIIEVKDTEGPSPRFYLHRNKTVTVYYSNFYAIPSSYYYREYDKNYGWFSGNLPFISSKSAGSGYYATYRGTISAWV
ncbi:hypothetical protein G15_0372 [Enterococcus avium]|nr:hypothetical protein G15_0372 [Enterococcus avium]